MESDLRAIVRLVSDTSGASKDFTLPVHGRHETPEITNINFDMSENSLLDRLCFWRRFKIRYTAHFPDDDALGLHYDCEASYFLSIYGLERLNLNQTEYRK